MVSAVRRITNQEKELIEAGYDSASVDFNQNLGFTINELNAIRQQIIVSGVKVEEERQKTEAIRERENIKLEAYEKKLHAAQNAREVREDAKELKNFKVFVQLERIMVAVSRQNGSLSIPKILISESFVSATKLIANKPTRVEVMQLIFLKQGEKMELLWKNPSEDSSIDIVSLLKGQGLTVNVSRRNRADLSEELKCLFSEVAEVKTIPFTVGYYRDESGSWKYAMPEETTMEKILKGGKR